LALGKDFFGIVRQPVKHAFGSYNEIIRHPLAEATTVEDVEAFPWPKVDWFDFSHLKEEISQVNGDRRYAIMYDRGGGAFEHPWYLRGFERFLLDLVEHPSVAEAIADHVVDFFQRLDAKALEASDGRIDIISSGGDIGGQRNMLVSPDLWRRHIKPYSRKLITPFKERGVITYYHSCGSIVSVIEDFIEMGLDILDPIQPNAAGMDPLRLKRQFGDRLTFHGGIDEQRLLPRGSPQEVRAEAGRLIDILGADGGYILCPAHAIQADTPVENILTLYDTTQGI
jgi:uroporphyrinogen decarboxylase